MIKTPDFRSIVDLSQLGNECVGNIDGVPIAVGDRIYDVASGLYVTIINDEAAVYLNVDNTISYIAWRHNSCWRLVEPTKPTAENPFPHAELIYVINGGQVFEGTIEQFRDCFFPDATPESIASWCQSAGCTLETRPLLFHTVGYANKTAFHPLGSYIGFERGPTVFATEVCYVSEAMAVVDDLLDLVEEQAATIKKLLKEHHE